MVQWMLEVNMSVILVQDDQEVTPLHLAALKNEQLNLLTALLENDNGNESAVYIQDNEGRVALHFATLQCNWDGLIKLVSFCQDSFEMVDNKGQNVVHYAANLGCLCKIKAILNLRSFDKLICDKDMNGILQIPYVSFSQVAPTGMRVWSYKRYRAIQKESADPQYEEVLALKQQAAYHVVVATLIATISFTAGFTLPGGLNQKPGENVGMAILTRKVALKAFLVSDAMAFIFSGLAIICYFMRVGLVVVDLLYKGGSFLIALSLGMLMIAFVSGVCVVVIESRILIVAVIVMVISAIFLPYLFLC